ncbi:MAG: THUMP domain-containing protein [Microcoleaceae cyanobacterium]
MVKIRLTTNRGLEEIAATEFSQKAKQIDLKIQAVQIKPWNVSGQVLIDLNHSIDQVIPIITQLRSVYQVIHHLYYYTLNSENPLISLQHQLLNLEIFPMKSASSFRVTSERYGHHDFNHLNIQQAAGSILVERYKTPVSLKYPELTLRVDLYDLHCFVGIALHSSNLDRRYHKPYQPKVTLNPTVAYAMLQFLKPNSTSNCLLDPFCGSGTILLEAATTLSNYKIYGSDYNIKTIAGVQQNIRAAKMVNNISIKQADARYLNQVYPANFFTAIVTNPPYGIRMGKQINFYHFYRLFLAGVSYVLKPQGRLLILVGKKSGDFQRVLHQYPTLQLLEFQPIQTGNFYPHLAVLEKKPSNNDYYESE